MKKSLLIQCALMVLFTLVLLWTVPATADHHLKAADAVKADAVTGLPAEDAFYFGNYNVGAGKLHLHLHRKLRTCHRLDR